MLQTGAVQVATQQFPRNGFRRTPEFFGAGGERKQNFFGSSRNRQSDRNETCVNYSGFPEANPASDLRRLSDESDCRRVGLAGQVFRVDL